MKKYLLIILFGFLINFSSQADHNKINYDANNWSKYEIKGSNDFYEFETDLSQDKIVLKDIENTNKTGLISYLFFENNKIKLDYSVLPNYISKSDNLLMSNSLGKSLVSYITGHAICEGYIDGIDVVLDDWSILENTLYHGQKLIDLLNMTAGDQNYIGQFKFNSDNLLKNGTVTGRNNVNTIPVEFMMKQLFQNSKKSSPRYNYNALTTNIIMQYIIFKSGDNFQNLLNKVFNENAKIKDSVFFAKSEFRSYFEVNGWYQFYAKRYDYLRVAKAIMDDWNNDTCVGKYLKTINENRVNKKFKEYKPKMVESYSKSYGGQFHLNLVGMEKRNIFGLGGYGGQQILIDMDKKKIVLVHSTQSHYNWKKIVYNKIK